MDKYVNNNGIKINYKFFDNQEGLGKTAVLIHGALSSSKYWEENSSLIAKLEQLNFSKICILNLRGHGPSEFPESGYTVEDHLSDIEAVVAKEDLHDINLIGHSLGAAYAIGWTLGSKIKDRVSSIVMGDYPALVPPFNQEWLDNNAEDMHHLDVHPDLPAKLFKEIEKVDYMPELSQVNVPVLILQGINGGILAFKDVERYFKGLRASTFLKVPTSHDNVFYNEETLKGLVNFLQNKQASVFRPEQSL